MDGRLQLLSAGWSPAGGGLGVCGVAGRRMGLPGMPNASCGHTVLINSLTLLKVTTRKWPDAAIWSLHITKTK